MMDVDGVVEVGIEIDRRTADEILATVLHRRKVGISHDAWARHQLKHGQRDTAGINLLEHLAHSFAWRVLGQFDSGNLELLETQPDGLVKAHQEHGRLRVLCVVLRARLPSHVAFGIKQKDNEGTSAGQTAIPAY